MAARGGVEPTTFRTEGIDNIHLTNHTPTYSYWLCHVFQYYQTQCLRLPLLSYSLCSFTLFENKFGLGQLFSRCKIQFMLKDYEMLLNYSLTETVKFSY